jgi:hypothetical protein
MLSHVVDSVVVSAICLFWWLVPSWVFTGLLSFSWLFGSSSDLEVPAYCSFRLLLLYDLCKSYWLFLLCFFVFSTCFMMDTIFYAASSPLLFMCNPSFVNRHLFESNLWVTGSEWWGYVFWSYVLIAYTRVVPELDALKSPLHSHIRKQTPWALVSKWIIPTEWPPLIDEVNANFCG